MQTADGRDVLWERLRHIIVFGTVDLQKRS